MKSVISTFAISSMFMFSGTSIADDHVTTNSDYMPSLITTTPIEGRSLAITIVRKTIGTIQRNGESKHRVRKIYAEDPMMLMRAAELVSLEFKTIAEANNYWK